MCWQGCDSATVQRGALTKAMRDLFEDIARGEPTDATEGVKRSVRPRPRRRFYENVGVVADHDGFLLDLDGRLVRTPARRTLSLPTEALAQTLAGEWRAQREVIDPV